ncbi:MAG: sigma-54 dependent transcriptional regulator [Sandaracinus sp.]
MTLKVLVVEDSAELRRVIERRLRSRGADVVATESVETAVDALTRDGGFHLVLLDVNLPEGSGLQVLERLPRGVRPPPTIVMTGDGSIENAVGAMRVGAKDFILKPFSLEALDAAIARVVAGRPKSRSVEVADPDGVSEWRRRHAPTMLGKSPELGRAFELMRRIADTDCAVLIDGETGTGKELVARAIHSGSDRARGPFVAINAAAIPEQLIESELFGHSKGAFTGAAATRTGRFVEASGGTLFLDEIGEMPLALQAKLLRALQEKEIVPLGDSKAVPVDVRIVAATNRDLEKMVEEKRFREDLLYRLDVIRIELPPLRKRRGDVPLLAQAMIEDTSARRGALVTGIEPDALAALEAYDWPGNVRQFANVIERMVILRGEGMLTLADVPEKVRRARPAPKADADLLVPELPEEGLDLRACVERFEGSLMRQALDRTGWNKNRAAAILHLNRTTLVEKLKKRGWMTTDDEAADRAAS